MQFFGARKLTGAEKFLNQQDRMRQKAFDRNNSRIQDQQAKRDEAFARSQDERDQRIAADMAERDWQRRNDDHKKSVFYAELQQARVEGRPSAYQSYTEVPDMERPAAPERQTSRLEGAFDTGTSFLLFVGIAVLVIVAVLVTAWRMFGGFIGQLLLLLLAVYAVMTAVWLVKRFALRASSPEELAAAEKWNPVTNTKRCVGFVRAKLRGSRS